MHLRVNGTGGMSLHLKIKLIFVMQWATHGIFRNNGSCPSPSSIDAQLPVKPRIRKGKPEMILKGRLPCFFPAGMIAGTCFFSRTPNPASGGNEK